METIGITEANGYGRAETRVPDAEYLARPERSP